MLEMIGSWARYRHLLAEMTRREFIDRYANHVIGSIWAWLHPLLLMLLYTVIFSVIFAARFGDTIELPRDFTTFVLTGIVPWLCIQDVLGRGSDAVVNHASYVKQMAFPIEVLPVKGALSSLPIFITGSAFLFLYQIIIFGDLPWLVLIWPLYFVFLAIFGVGLALLLSAIGVFVRDLREFVGVFCTANLFLTPIIYIPGVAPDALRYVFSANPFSYMIWVYRDIMFYGRIEHPLAWIVFPLMSVVTAMVGTLVFRRLQPHFGDAI